MDNQFHLKIASREGTVFEGVVSSITSYNPKGKFDILENHTNFISLIQDKVILRESKDSEKEIVFKNALMRVRENNVEIYIGVEGKSVK